MLLLISQLRETNMTDVLTKTSKFTFSRLDELPRGETTNALIYGGSGSFKTGLVGTLGDRSLYIDTGRGAEILKSKWYREMYPGCNPIVVEVREKIGSRGLPHEAAAFDLVCDVIDYMLEKETDKFDHIVVDDLTSVRRLALFKGLDINQKTNKSQTQVAMKTHSMILTAVQDYGAEMSLVMQFCAGYIDICMQAGKNFFVVAHERHYLEKPKNAQGNPIIGEIPIIKKIRPAVTGVSFPDDVSGLFENIWHSEAVGSGSGAKYRLRLLGDDVILAKTRLAGIWKGAVLPDVLDKVEVSRYPNGPNLLQMLTDVKLSRGA